MDQEAGVGKEPELWQGQKEVVALFKNLEWNLKGTARLPDYNAKVPPKPDKSTVTLQ